MGIVLYRNGNTHIEKGVPCELKVVRPELFNGKPEKGWFLTPGKINAWLTDDQEWITKNYQDHISKIKEVDNGLQKETKTKKTEEEINPVVRFDYDKMTNKEIRQHAKNAKIKDYSKARIQTLIDKLKAL